MVLYRLYRIKEHNESGKNRQNPGELFTIGIKYDPEVGTLNEITQLIARKH